MIEVGSMVIATDPLSKTTWTGEVTDIVSTCVGDRRTGTAYHILTEHGYRTALQKNVRSS